MIRRIVLVVGLVAAACSNAQAFHFWGGHHGCGSCCEPTCCAPEPTCCAPAPSCCAPKCCGHKKLFSCFHKKCCKPACCAPACEPSCCAPAAPCAAEPSCCAAPACEPSCCAPAPCCEPCCKKHHCFGHKMKHFFHKCKSCCKPACCEPACGCEPSCCAAVEPSCCGK